VIFKVQKEELMSFLAVPILTLASFGLIAAMLYGQCVRNGIFKVSNRLQLQQRMVALGSLIAILCWIVAWQRDGIVAMLFQYWWIGIFPFTIAYGFEAMAEDGQEKGMFWSWLKYCVVLSIPVLGQVGTIVFALGCLSNGFCKEYQVPSISTSTDAPQ
jgi:hypothetical protein